MRNLTNPPLRVVPRMIADTSTQQPPLRPLEPPAILVNFGSSKVFQPLLARLMVGEQMVMMVVPTSRNLSDLVSHWRGSRNPRVSR